MIILAATLIFLPNFYPVNADIVVNLSPSNLENNRCRETIVINPGNETSVFATKKVPDGHCTLFFRTTRTKDSECSKFCVTFRKKSFKDCYVKVKFTAVKFDNNGDQTNVYDCWHQNNFAGPWCPTTDKLQMDVIESEPYHYSYQDLAFKGSYDFSVDVTPVCSPKTFMTVTSKTDTCASSLLSIDLLRLYQYGSQSDLQYNENGYGEYVKDTTTLPAFNVQLNIFVKNSNQKKNDRMEQIKVEGIVVGTCLACIFLVLLVVMYLYYKSKAIDDVTGEESSKRGAGMIFTSIRGRFGGKSTTARSENDNFDKYQEVRQTDDDLSASTSHHNNKSIESSPV